MNNIFDKIKFSRKNKSSPASTVDGVSGPESISNRFKTIYEDIFNVHKDGQVELLDFLDSIDKNITASDLGYVDKITSPLIRDIISNLHNNKNDVIFNWGSDALKHGAADLALHLEVLFKLMLIHGHIPDLFTFCALIPLVKDGKKSKTSSDNYRLIASSSLILKILDYLILSIFNQSFMSPHLQFGFQKNLSTTFCTWTLLESINYFTNRGGAMYVCLLDLTKAFDQVKHDILFKKLSAKVPSVFLRLIIVSYLCQTCCVAWENYNSEIFTACNGVRQGAVASPLYFNAYLDDLFVEMKTSGYGCYIDDFYYGILGYADDCALLSPSRESLQKMLNICIKYFQDHGIKISVNEIESKSKTKCLAFNAISNPAKLSLYNLVLPWVTSAVHLGHTISTDDESKDIFLPERSIYLQCSPVTTGTG